MSAWPAFVLNCLRHYCQALSRRILARLNVRVFAAGVALLTVGLQIGCGGSASAPSGTGSRSTPGPAVTISPSSAQVAAGGAVTFTATVLNAANTAVTWQVNGVPGGNSLAGTISAAGAATASYVAPANVSTTISVTISAVLQADGVTTGSATVTVMPLAGTSVTVNPASGSVAAGTSLQLMAVVQNGPQAVIWEVNGIQNGSAKFGTISAPVGSLNATYNAPAQIPNPPVVTISALLSTDVSISGTASITIIPPPISVSVSPSTANVGAGKTLQFAAAVQGSNASVTWEVNGESGGDPAIGTITPSGTFTAPSAAATVTVTAVLVGDSSIFGSAEVTIVSAESFTGVYSWRNDSGLTGQNSHETILTPGTVNASTFGKLYGCPVDGAIFAQPLYVANAAAGLPGVVSADVVYVATENGSVYAFVAGSCQTLWRVSLLGAGETAVPAADVGTQLDIVPQIGITGTPVIDPSTATLYAVAKSKDSTGGYFQRLHALDLVTGQEKFGGPALIHASVKGNGDGSSNGQIPFDPRNQNQRAALALSGGNVFVAFDSYQEIDPFHGWLFAFNATGLANPPAVFISTPNQTSTGADSRGGIGEDGAAPSSDQSGNVFAVTSDGAFDPPDNDYAESLLALRVDSTSRTIAPADRFTPADELALQFSGPFGSTGALLLPPEAGTASHPDLALAGDLSGNLYLLDRGNLATGALQTLCLGAHITGTPTFSMTNGTPTIYVAAADDTLKAFPMTGGLFTSRSCSAGSAVPDSQSRETFATFGASPAISSNAGSGGIVWAIDTSGYIPGGTSSPAILRAYDATNLVKELYVSPSDPADSGAPGPAVKFAVPTVANGKVYVGTQNELSVFGILP